MTTNAKIWSNQGLASLNRMIQAHYGRNVVRLVPHRTVYGVWCDDGTSYVWKTYRNPDSVRRLVLLNPVLRRLEQVGLPVPRFVYTRRGLPFVRLDGEQYGTLQTRLPGRHADFSTREEFLRVVATVACMHQVTRESLHIPRAPLVQPIEERIRLKSDLLESVWGRAKQTFHRLACIEPDVMEVLAETRAVLPHVARLTRSSPDLAFCHRDLAPHNLLCNEETGQVGIIDFDCAGWDHGMLDLVQLANHALHARDVNAGHFHDILRVYERISPVQPVWRDALWRLFRFPDILIRLLARWANGESVQETDVDAAVYKEMVRWTIWTKDTMSRYTDT